jgi:hypothetical protein
LLRRLSALTPVIHPLSHCRVTARNGVLDRATGARGVILQVARLAWVHAAAADVVGGYYITHRHAAAFRYGVELEGPCWAVTTAALLWRVWPSSSLVTSSCLRQHKHGHDLVDENRIWWVEMEEGFSFEDLLMGLGTL